MRLGLILAIGISLLLSWKIWTNNSHYERQTDSQTTQKTPTRNADHQLADTFLPTQVLWRQSDQSELLYNSKENIVTQLKKTLKKTQIAAFKKVKLNETRYGQQLKTDKTVTLLYPDDVTYGILKEVFSYQGKNRGGIKNNATFNRIQITLGSKTADLWLLNDRTKVGYQAELTGFSKQKIKELVNASDVHLKVEEQFLNHKPLMYVAANQQLAPYSYLVNQQPENYYISSLLNQQNTDSINTKEQGDSAIYTDGTDSEQYKRLTIDHKTGEISFIKYEDVAVPKTTTKQFETSFDALLKTGNSLAGMRYYSHDEKTDTTTFRTYVEGFPVFYQTNFGSVKVQLLPTGQRVDFSNYSLQVPVPAEDHQVTLDSTESVLNQLTQNGFLLEDVDNIQVGYEWTKESDNDQVIDLNPTYFIQYQGTWRSLSALLALKTELTEGSWINGFPKNWNDFYCDFYCTRYLFIYLAQG